MSGKERKGKKFFSEFREFIARGNAFQLAIGVIIGAAFQGIVNSLVNDIIMPVIGIILSGIDFKTLGYSFNNPITGEVVTIAYGNFISAVINFIIMAFVIFAIIKIFAKIESSFKKNKEEIKEEAPTTKVCPYCKSEIDIEATKCPHCTSDVE